MLKTQVPRTYHPFYKNATDDPTLLQTTLAKLYLLHRIAKVYDAVELPNNK
jgi:hypothetical protein